MCRCTATQPNSPRLEACPHAHGASFPGCQRDVVYLSSALIHLSAVPSCTSDIRGDVGEDIGVIETGVVGRVKHGVRERPPKCREETAKRGDNLKWYPNG